MTALIIGPDEERLLLGLKRQAEASRPVDVRAAIAAGPAAAEANKAFTVTLPMDFAVTLTREQQPEAGLCWHFSMSVAKAGRVPNIRAVEMTLEALGLRPIRESLSVWLEDIGQGDKAVNVVQRCAP